MVNTERFLTVRLADHHRKESRCRHEVWRNGKKIELPRPTHLVIECNGPEWILYYLDSDGKIQTHTHAASLDAAFDQANFEFDIVPEEWTEEFAQ